MVHFVFLIWKKHPSCHQATCIWLMSVCVFIYICNCQFTYFLLGDVCWCMGAGAESGKEEANQNENKGTLMLYRQLKEREIQSRKEILCYFVSNQH